MNPRKSDYQQRKLTINIKRSGKMYSPPKINTRRISSLKAHQKRFILGSHSPTRLKNMNRPWLVLGSVKKTKTRSKPKSKKVFKIHKNNDFYRSAVNTLKKSIQVRSPRDRNRSRNSYRDIGVLKQSGMKYKPSPKLKNAFSMNNIALTSNSKVKNWKTETESKKLKQRMKKLNINMTEEHVKSNNNTLLTPHYPIKTLENNPSSGLKNYLTSRKSVMNKSQTTKNTSKQKFLFLQKENLKKTPINKLRSVKAIKTVPTPFFKKREKKLVLVSQPKKSKNTKSNHTENPSTSESHQTTHSKFKLQWVSDYWPDIWSQLIFGKCIGEGSFSRVYDGFDKLRRKQVAIKVIKKKIFTSDKKKMLVQNEINLLNTLRHPNIVNLERILEDEKRIFIITELCPTITLNRFSKSNRLGRVVEDVARGIFKQIVSGIEHVHNQGCCHRDLKVTNILINTDEMQIKIIDFGFACVNTNSLKLYCGTRSYMAPEIIKKEHYDGKICDIWSLGVVLYKLLTGDYPFGGEGDDRLKEKIKIGKFKYPFYVSDKAKKLIDGMLRKDKEKRFTIGKVKQHDWMKAGP